MDKIRKDEIKRILSVIMIKEIKIERAPLYLQQLCERIEMAFQYIRQLFAKKITGERGYLKR